MADDSLPMNLPPQVAQFLRSLNDKQARQSAQFDALAKAYRDLRTRSEGDKMEIQRLGEWVQKAAKRIKYIEDIPGKRVPYTMNFEIDMPSDANTPLPVGARVRAQQQLSMDGPFVGSMLMGAFRMRTYSLGLDAVLFPNMPPAGEEVVTPFTGRFRPIASTTDGMSGAYIGIGTGTNADPQVAAAMVNTHRPGTVDFLWEYTDGGTDRARQNEIPSPSRYLFSENDRPFYLAVSDFFERGSTITFYVTLLRSLGLVEASFSSGYNGYVESAIAPAVRATFAVGGTLTLSIHGYKILQAQSPSV